MNKISLPPEYNYIACFLTLACNLKCSYCINLQNDHTRRSVHHGRPPMGKKEWVAALNRIEATEELPITIQGGEPTVHPYFYDIIESVDKPMDLLTNVQFNMDEFKARILPSKFKRWAPYSSIRVSYHPEQMELKDTATRVLSLLECGYQVGVWSVLVPKWEEHILNDAKPLFTKLGIDFRVKEMLDGGTEYGSECGTYKYKEAVGSPVLRACMCRTTELLIAPDGSIHRCHSDLYNLRRGIGHILDEEFVLTRDFRSCSVYGDCSGCDIKVTTNRFQHEGWTSVEIKDVNWNEGTQR